MTSPADPVVRSKPLRLWPGIAAALVVVLALVADAMITSNGSVLGVMAGVAGALAIVVWWLFFSRAPWLDRLGALVLMVAALVVVRPLLHPSIAGAGMDRLFFIVAIVAQALAVVAWAIFAGAQPPGRRRAWLVAAVFGATGAFTLLRIGGITAELDPDLHWRWTPTPEERLLAAESGGTEVPPYGSSVPSSSVPPSAIPSSSAAPSAVRSAGTPPPMIPSVRPVATAGGTTVPPYATGGTEVPPYATPPIAAPPEWPGFRGPNRDGVVSGVRIDTDWAASPPELLWRRPIGPGWSSFAVHGGRIYTQEQRGEDEVVACYDRATGDPVWMHRDEARFYESNGGAGPRATPTLHAGRVYTLGATGIVNALDAATGAVIWSRNAQADTGAELPGWGFAGSPLAVGDLVIVAASGALIAYDTATGAPRWKGPSGGAGYSSPHLATIDGVPQVLLLRGSRTTSVAIADGTVLWEHMWQPSVSIVQPVVTPEGDVFVAPGDAMGGIGMRRLSVARGPDGWSASERWTTRGLKPYFNDFVVHEGHAYGFDGSILACIDVETGTRMWKGGRYGSGQLVLLADQDVLLVVSEEGGLALVAAVPDGFKEIARIPALDAKTWNHPVLVGDQLLVRNGEEMAAYRLALAAR